MASKYEEAEIYTDLRTRALSLIEKDFGKPTPILAMLMETGYSEAVATLIAIADGSASLYFSNGGGIIGAGEYRQVNESAFELLRLAHENLDQFVLTNDFPLPEERFTRFYVITGLGVYTAEVLEDDLGNERHSLSDVFFQGHELISYIRSVDAYRDAEEIPAIEPVFQVVANGLEIELPNHLDLTFQVVPSYDEREPVLAGWEGEDLLYFMTFRKLPPGWLDPEKWFSGLKRDLKAASGKEVEIVDCGAYKSEGAYDVSYIAYRHYLKSDSNNQYQIASFLTDHERSYIAFTAPTNDSAIDKMLSDTLCILSSVRTQSSNVIPLTIRNEDKFVGLWSGESIDENGSILATVFELRNDLSFNGEISMGGVPVSSYSGYGS